MEGEAPCAPPFTPTQGPVPRRRSVQVAGPESAAEPWPIFGIQLICERCFLICESVKWA